MIQSWNSELRSQHLCEKCWLWICTSQNLRVGDKEINGASWLLSCWKNSSSMFNERLCLKVTRQRMIRGVTWHPYLPSSYRNRYFCPHTLAHIHQINLHTPMQKMVVEQTCRPNQGQSVQWLSEWSAEQVYGECHSIPHKYGQLKTPHLWLRKWTR